jgi:hypothetical protein
LFERFQAGQKSNELIKSLLEDPAKSDVLHNIQNILLEVTRLKLRGHWEGSVWKEDALPKDYNREEIFTNVVDLIKNLPKLRSLTFRGNGQVPLILINALQEYLPRTSLHVQGWKRLRPDEDHNNPVEIALAKSLNLRSISTSFADTGTLYDLRSAAFKRIIALAPNLESVHIMPADERSLMSFTDIPNLRYIEEHRRGQLFEIKNPSSNAIKTLITSHGHEIHTWENATDMAKLERLETRLGPPSLLKPGEQTPRLQSLAHISFSMITHHLEHAQRMNDDMNNFLTICKPLQSLSIDTWFKTLAFADILPHHGSTLRKLYLHDTEAILPMTLLKDIRDHCTELQDFELDMKRSSDGKAEAELLSALSTFPKLRIVRLNISPGITGVHYAENPFWTKNPGWLERMWVLLSPLRLEELHVKIGKWDNMWWGGGRYISYDWGEEEGESWRCVWARRSERDDRPDEIMVIKCLADYALLKSRDWEVRTLPRRWRFGEMWSRPRDVARFEEDPPVVDEDDL